MKDQFKKQDESILSKAIYEEVPNVAYVKQKSIAETDQLGGHNFAAAPALEEIPKKTVDKESTKSNQSDQDDRTSRNSLLSDSVFQPVGKKIDWNLVVFLFVWDNMSGIGIIWFR